MADETPGSSGADKTPDQIEQEMTQTRESIAEKVSLLESQVMGNIHSLTGTVESVKEAVADTVQTVREAVVGAPAAVSDTVKQTLSSVGDTVKETFGSFSVSDKVRANPWAALGTSAGVGFVVGLLIPGGRPRPLMARGNDEPVSGGRVGTVHTAYQGFTPPARDDRPAEPGLFGGLWAMVGQEVKQLAKQALDTALASAKQAIQTQVPQAVDTAVQGLTDRVASAANGLGNGAAHGTARVGGPNTTATPPAGGL